MTQLSVIIVNYNVSYFLEQALLSVQKAVQSMTVEIIVVDNASADDSVDMVRQKFPTITLIANPKNVGFSTANNQGIRIAKGKYVLLLNPDTVVQEDTFKKCFDFMEAHPDAGAVGVKMIDGKGIFLPESKRGLPTPMVAFYKIFGLSSLFPTSPTFSRYHLGHLSNDETHEIEVLSGAFMFMRAAALDKIGGLDETYFMYGEDIDLSYRILKADFKNYYFPDTTIIHYKGESTKKGSLNYVRMFYQAMIIFAQKHFSPKQAGIYTFAIHTAVYFRAMIAVLSRILFRTLLPLTDALLLFMGLFFIKGFWETNIKAAENTTYALEYLYINLPIYIFIWLTSMFFSGGYDRPLKVSRMVRGILAGTIIISAVYGFLPEHLRFSRGMIVVGTAWAAFALVGLRVLLHFFKYKNFDIDETVTHRAIIVGSEPENRRVRNLLSDAGVQLDLIGFVSPHATDSSHPQYLGKVQQLQKLAILYRANEIIFCGQSIDNQTIIQQMTTIVQAANYKIVPPNSRHIIGSNSKNTAGDYYSTDTIFNISQNRNRRNKRMFDLFICLLVVLLLPVFIFLKKRGHLFLKNWSKVLSGKYTWVGYTFFSKKEKPQSGKKKNNLSVPIPALKPGVFSPLDAFPAQNVDDTTAARLNYLYARDYSSYRDAEIVFKKIVGSG